MDFIEYTFYDETGKYIAIIKENTPATAIAELSRKFDEVKYRED